MNILIKVISSIFYYFFPSLQQQNNSMTEERGFFRGDPSIHPFFNFFLIGKVCIRKYVLHRSEEIVIRRCQIWRVGWRLDARGFPIQVVKVFLSRFSQHAVERYHATK